MKIIEKNTFNSMKKNLSNIKKMQKSLIKLNTEKDRIKNLLIFFVLKYLVRVTIIQVYKCNFSLLINFINNIKYDFSLV